MKTDNTTTSASTALSGESKVNQASDTSTSEVKNPWVLAGLLQMANETIEDFGQLQSNVSQMTAKMSQNTVVQAKAQNEAVHKKIVLSKTLDKLEIAAYILAGVAGLGAAGSLAKGATEIFTTISSAVSIGATAAGGATEVAAGGIKAFSLAPIEREIGELEASSEDSMTGLKDTTAKLRSMSETQGQIQNGYVSSAEKITQSMV